MALYTDAFFADVASRALERAGVTEPPVPIEALVEAHGVPIRYVRLPLFFFGAMVSEDGMPVMVVNWAQPEDVRRWTIAHMLGHVLLVLEGPEHVYPRDSRDHSEADRVALELIMPQRMVAEHAKLWFNDYRYLAGLFAVTEDQMLDRMRKMGIIKGPRGIMLDL